MLDNPIVVKDIPPLKMISTGLDHFLGLDKNGKVYAMGDDTFGQCGQGDTDRNYVAPFYETRWTTPKLVSIKEPVTKVVCGFRHSLAITNNGKLYGWGFNSMQQLSNSDQY
jgi:alpha-tubulin suppressor-like RCC1 family protein